MKKVLITGENSYIGKSFESWVLKKYENDFEVHKISLKNEKWIEMNFKDIDVVLHVAGIVHKKEKKIADDLYYEVNKDLTFKLAEKAKKEGVRHFIFISTMNVYGVEKGTITRQTTPNPTSHYGKSKLEGEKAIKCLESDLFKISIIRPPMVYGYECTGNYKKLSNIIPYFFAFPVVENKRSMIFIDNLSEFLVKAIEGKVHGVLFPQNDEYVRTKDLIEEIARVRKKRIFFINKVNFFTKLINLLNNKSLNKIFGSLVYDSELSKYPFEYNVITFKESIERSEKGESHSDI